jgi:hypothetical protein
VPKFPRLGVSFYQTDVLLLQNRPAFEAKLIDAGRVPVVRGLLLLLGLTQVLCTRQSIDAVAKPPLFQRGSEKGVNERSPKMDRLFWSTTVSNRPSDSSTVMKEL